jgi:protein-S-isoprenylcysteine O-methyltransferase Ste14
MKFLERGGIWVVSQAVLLLSVLGLSLVFHSSPRSQGMLLAGVSLLIVGGGFGTAGFLALRGNLTPFPKPRPGGSLVRSGIYAWVRHPLYTSVLLSAIGWALAWQSWPALLAALCLAPFFEAKARREENWLREQFAEYAEYARQTRRFIPWIY